ncbi:hypothetical protein SAMN05421837_103397 [Amycolatopsis pretoriensis]|uniref:CDP-Glycerol:Poly(Glycerophosphate) glycerophosphotransferase n=1 Tax=Amycolatopsis pretoriensis TaxID=218821 RepID=A0A1H5QKK4_9PSEU|nr:hypothetical protein [Amycolatopsis pretoriensis]SEF26575.1 hypothetical protein SAMN05421837_103397 [Amycolatopsis pretoriensis]
MRSFAAANRLLRVLQDLGPGTVEIVFVMEPDSLWADGVIEDLTGRGATVLSWDQGREIEFDVILAAHASARFAELRGPAVVMPHGAGHNRDLSRITGGRESVPTGLARSQLLRADGQPAVARVLLSHPSQREWLRRTCPEIAHLAVVLGDPVLDRMCGSQRWREKFRRELGLSCGQRLVVVSSTWGPYSLWGRHGDLARRLLGSLPMDEYRLALVLHPNIWRGESPFAVQHSLRDELDSGLLLVPHQSSWEAVIMAADVVIGDHGSVSFYGATLDIPFLLAADGRRELIPGSPTAELCATANALDLDSPFEPQVARAIEHHDPALLRPAVDLMFANRGKARETLQRVLYEAMGRRPPDTTPRLRAIDSPRPLVGKPPTAFAVSADLVEAEATCGTVVARRFPLLATNRQSTDPVFYVVTDLEVDPDTYSDAEIVIGEEIPEDLGAWFADVRAYSPYAALVAVRTAAGCILRFLDGVELFTTDKDVSTTSIAAFAWRRAQQPVPDALRLRADVGGRLSERVVIRRRG